jgi:hypothetical protein
MSDEDSVAARVQATVDAFGRLDMAFTNAGIQVPLSDATDELAEHFDRVNAVNYRDVWACMNHELAQMRPQGSGAIVNCSSIGGLIGGHGRASYHALEHGVIGLTTCWFCLPDATASSGTEELRIVTWGDRPVTGSALSSTIHLLRRKLVDDGGTQAIIRTVHGRGFRVIADIEQPKRYRPDNGK